MFLHGIHRQNFHFTRERRSLPRRSFCRVVTVSVVFSCQLLPLLPCISRRRARSLLPYTSPSSSNPRSGSRSCSAATRSRGSRSVRYLPLYIMCPQSEHVRCSRATCAGCLTTAGVLSVGFGAFIAGNKVLAQYMMRARVAAQGATVVAMVVSAGGLFMPSKAETQGAPRL